MSYPYACQDTKVQFQWHKTCYNRVKEVAMKQTLKMTQKLNQTLQLSLSMKQSLNILKMNQADLLSRIQEIVDCNPMIEYSPPTDMHQYLNEAIHAQPTLQDELYLQLHTCQQAYEERIANFIIESLDDNGFLSYPIASYCQSLNISIATFNKQLQLIQSFEPCGVAARNSVDSIAVQLRENRLDDALRIWNELQNELIHKNYNLIAKRLNLSVDEVQQCIWDIQACDPFPCRNYTTKKEQFILPDVELSIIDNRLQIDVAQMGHIHIDDELKQANITPAVKAYFQEAYYFVDSLNKRNKTLLIMANALFHIQKNYFLFHDELQSCTLSEIAQKCGFHESTVSRTLSNKYYLFENELYPMKHLFVSATKHGSSKDAIQKAIQQLVEKEDKTAPLSDKELVASLAQLELYVSRRAIAKYREQLCIPNSKSRKKKT